MDNDTIIKSEDFAERKAVPFQFDDVRALANQVLKRAAEQANRKLMAAEKQAQDVEKAAYDDGFKKGEAEGFAKGEPEGRAAGDSAARNAFTEATKTVAPALSALLKELELRKTSLQAEAEADFFRLALGMAERIVRREIRTDANFILPVVREAIGLMNEREDLVAHLHPDDIAAVEKELPALKAAFTDLGRVRLEADEGVERGGVVVKGRAAEADLRIATQLAAFERALLGESAATTEPASAPPVSPESGEKNPV